MQRLWFGFVFLVGCVPEEVLIQDGADVYAETCIVCHGPTGLGEPETEVSGAKDLSVMIPTHDDESLRDVIIGGTDLMPPQRLREAEIRRVIAYLRHEFGAFDELATEDEPADEDTGGS